MDNLTQTDAPQHASTARAETGPMRFGDDWTGIFVRGDNCFGYCLALRQILDGSADPIVKIQVQGLLNTLANHNEHGNVIVGIQQMRPFGEASSDPVVATPAEEGKADPSREEDSETAGRPDYHLMAFHIHQAYECQQPDEWRRWVESYLRTRLSSPLDPLDLPVAPVRKRKALLPIDRLGADARARLRSNK